MKTALLTTVLPAIVALCGGWLLITVAMDRTLLLKEHKNLGLEIELRTEGRDGSADREQSTAEVVGTLEKGSGTAVDLPGAWPRFRGANLDNINREEVPLARDWGDAGPLTLWSTDLGEGYAAASVLNGRVYIMDYDQTRRADALRCLSLADGKEIWRYTYPVMVKRNHGMSRTMPTVTEKYVVAMGPKCHVTCLDAVTGEKKWAIDLVREWKAKVPLWYAGQCPLIENDRVILAPGGESLMFAADLATGSVLWKSPNPRRWNMTHSSIMPMVFNGKRMYVYCGKGGVAGVAAEDGSPLWETTAWKISIATVPSPICLEDGRIFLTGGYNAGSLMLKLVEENGALTVKEVFRQDADAFASIQQTPILYQEHLYAIRYDGQLACMDLGGTTVWTSGPAKKFGLGPLLLAQDMLYVVNDTGTLTLAEASSARYKQLAEATIFEDGHDAWGPLTLAGGRLLLRDLRRMVCLDVRKN